MKKVYIYEACDPCLHVDDEETVGVECLIPEGLYLRYKAADEEFLTVQELLDKENKKITQKL